MKLHGLFSRVLGDRRGQGLVEYGILIGGVALVCLAAVAILGHKSNDLVATCAAVLPCAHDEDEGPIVSGQLVATETTTNGGAHVIDSTSPGSMADNLGLGSLEDMVVEPGYTP